MTMMVSQMEDYVQYCFNDLHVDKKKVDAMIKEAMEKDGPEGKAARKKINVIYRSMTSQPVSRKGARAAGFAIRECMDNAFVLNLGSLSRVENLFANQGSHRWRAAMDSYFKQIVKDLPKVLATIVSATAMTDMDEPMGAEEKGVGEALRLCMGKIKVLHAVVTHPSLQSSTFGMVPFMSQSVYSHMVKNLDAIDGALKEVSTFCDTRPCRFPDKQGVSRANVTLSSSCSFVVGGNP